MSNTKKMSLAALICGILGIVGGWISVVQNFTFVLAIVAIVLGSKVMKDSSASAEEVKQAKLGRLLGIIGVVFTICVYIVTFVLIGAMM